MPGSPGSPGWVRPGDVMRVRKLRAKRQALQARMSGPGPLLVPASPKQAKDTRGVKRRNPFRCSPNKKIRPDDDDPDVDVTSDASLFRLLSPAVTPTPTPAHSYSFTNILRQQEGKDVTVPEEPSVAWCEQLVVDWSLKSRLRFKSHKPLPWKHIFKTSEEASGITGFVRCLSSATTDEDRTLDTSANAQFYQCCLVWQHPALPWLQLFPRDGGKLTAQTGIFATDKKLGDSLHNEWSQSLLSLHQLLRVRQCPYFYVCGPSFTCLFRAAGVAGISEAHALITPTTRGFREAMKNEDIEFKMPFHTKGGGGEEGEEEKEEEDEASEEAASWLEDLGVETSQFPSLNPNRVKLEREKFKTIDNTGSSLVYVEGVETQGLLNFLLNSKSCVATTGALAGVPPTLLAPVAFQGATLKTLKVKGSTIRQEGGTSHAMEISGPVLPHTVHSLASLLAKHQQFTLSLHPLTNTTPFSEFVHTSQTSVPQAFAQEGLVDCGLDASLRSVVCSAPDTGPPDLPKTYREVTFAEGKFTWTDKVN